MCGIFCCIRNLQLNNVNQCDCLQNDGLYDLLINRGPNAQRIIRLENVGITLAGFVLWHQGHNICTQPVESDNEILLFNGDISNLNDRDLKGASDTEWLLEKLSAINGCDADKYFIQLFSSIEGPFSCIFYNRLTKFLYFLRDSFGRNSLIVETNGTSHLRILSTTSLSSGKLYRTMELPTIGLFKFHVDDITQWTIIPWVSIIDEIQVHIENINKTLGVNVICIDNLVMQPDWLLPIEFRTKYTYNFYDYVTMTNLTNKELYDCILSNLEVEKSLKEFSFLLEKSIANRVRNTVRFCRDCIQTQRYCNHSKIAIFFSGGLDCTILAFLSDKFVDAADTIDLINVAFQPVKNEKSTNWNVPDRLTAIASFEELKLLCPQRKWNFITVDVTRIELQSQLSSHIKHLIFPLNVVLDESIGSAFWFAARGSGHIGPLAGSSTARVIIVGTGADELFGGYIRHRNAYLRCNGNETEKQLNVLKELEIDWKRLPSRNLARDDRVIADSGKTVRTPYIEEHLVRYVRSLLPCQRCCFTLPCGIGDKILLRLYAYSLGLVSSTFQKKRAIQFGSRIANKNQMASDLSIYIK